MTSIRTGAAEATDEAVAVKTGEDDFQLKPRLSSISKMYDVNGDGVLDEAEQAMRNLDTSKRGFLTNDKVYELMKEHNEMQKSLFKFRKIVAGLVIFVVLLTLCNLGTSLAAAYLASDTITNSENELINKDTNEVVSTQTVADDYQFTRAYNETEGTRRLCDKSNDGVYTCETASYLEMPLEDGQHMVKKCKKGETVNLKRTWHDESETLIHLCPTPKGTYSPRQSRFKNGVTMTISGDGNFYTLSGDALAQDENDVCDETGDCDSELVCKDNEQAITACKKRCDELKFGPSRLQPCKDACVFRSCQASSTDE